MKNIRLLITSVVVVVITIQNLNAQQDSLLSLPYLPVYSTDSISPAFRFVEKMPEFPGGVDGFSAFISREIIYPESCRQLGITGVVMVEFIVEKNGTISNVKVISPIYPDLDNEALRVIKKSPKWKPAIHNGKPVRVYFEIPIRFTLND